MGRGPSKESLRLRPTLGGFRLEEGEEGSLGVYWGRGHAPGGCAYDGEVTGAVWTFDGLELLLLDGNFLWLLFLERSITSCG